MGNSRTYFCIILIQLIAIATAQETSKRLPHGFVGVRGKRYNDDSTEQFYKRKPQFFVGVKGKKTLYDFLENSDGYLKRAPMGFYGVRGKKESLFSDGDFYPQNYEASLKRDGSLIGQIDYTSGENTGNAEFPVLNEILNEYLKKLERPEMAVDSNDTEDVRITNEVEKRAANMHQFYGVRGKKSAINKRPYDVTFRGKFIGVRGKKDLKNSPQEIKFLVNGPFPKRKGPIGFFGMRGKKWTDESTSEMETPN